RGKEGSQRHAPRRLGTALAKERAPGRQARGVRDQVAKGYVAWVNRPWPIVGGHKGAGAERIFVGLDRTRAVELSEHADDGLIKPRLPLLDQRHERGDDEQLGY